eukprot:TRINITY_DN21_c0_g1_i1.p1 TRINITY_DN21_c0_g1~~TRINITY_DN21_c0_g1_i1.p1  ORF type:complete len:680 (-),score=275.29 TRINITY_DN21_c0_g1_i1:79-2118(-)
MPIRQDFVVPITNDDEWKEAVLTPGLVIIDVHAGWVGPCTSIKSVFKKAFFEFSSERALKFYSASADDIAALAQFRNKSRPVFLAYTNGALDDIYVGVRAVQLSQLFESAPQKDSVPESIPDPGSDFTRPITPPADVADGRSSRVRIRNEQEAVSKGGAADASASRLDLGRFDGEPSEILIRIEDALDANLDPDQATADVQEVLAENYSYLQDLHEEWSPSDIDSDAATSISYEAFVNMARAYDVIGHDEREPAAFVHVFKQSLAPSDQEDPDAADAAADDDKGGDAADDDDDDKGDADGDADAAAADKDDDKPINVAGCIIFEDFLTLFSRLAIYNGSQHRGTKNMTPAEQLKHLLGHIQHIKDPEQFPEDVDNGDAAPDSLGPTPTPGPDDGSDAAEAKGDAGGSDGEKPSASPTPPAAAADAAGSDGAGAAADDDVKDKDKDKDKDKKEEKPAEGDAADKPASPEPATSKDGDNNKSAEEAKDSKDDTASKEEEKQGAQATDAQDEAGAGDKQAENDKTAAPTADADADATSKAKDSDTDATPAAAAAAAGPGDHDGDDDDDKPAAAQEEASHSEDNKTKAAADESASAEGATDNKGDDKANAADATSENKDDDAPAATASKDGQDGADNKTEEPNNNDGGAAAADDDDADVKPVPPAAPKPDGGARRPAPRTKDD